LLQDKLDVQEKMKLQDKELKDALSQRKLAMAEYTEVTDRFVFCYFEFVVLSHNNNNNIYLLQLGYYPVAVVILHVNKT